MAQEFETKILEINQESIEKKLIEIGAVLQKDTILMRRWVFDVKTHEEWQGKWIRLRQIGDKTTITYKDRNGNEIGSTKELETSVENFEVMAEILQKLPWNTTAYQENKRKVYVYDNIEFCIDTWPSIPTYLEIESTSLEKVQQWLELLWLTGKDIWDVGMVEIYKKYGIDLHSHKVLKF